MTLLRQKRSLIWLTLSVGFFLFLAGYQLGLPGLHYDEAKEAGVNAMELLTGAPVTAFRGAVFQIGGLSLPLMVQDYIGALNVYLALPFLALTGVGVPNLRFLALILAVLALLFLERAISAWTDLHVARNTQRSGNPSAPPAARPLPISLAALITLTLLVASPSFVFWNRQGIFVTNATLPAVYFAIWQGLRWLRTGEERSLIMAAFAAGLALYAKLLSIWLILPFALGLIGWWLWMRRRSPSAIPRVWISAILKAALAGTIPLLPFWLFNWQTGGTFRAIGSNLGQSYYGINNADLIANLPLRLEQLLTSLRGGQFWYLGALQGNNLAPWLWVGLILVGLLLPRSRHLVGPPLLLLGGAVLLSLFTVSDLFITHYALIHPLAVAVAGIALASIFNPESADLRPTDQRRFSPAHWRTALLSLVVLFWFALDLSATLAYHRDLGRSGGLADHADTTYHLAYHLRYNGLGAPVALDWGMDAPVRYLSEGTVQPIEIFGYGSLTEPDADYARQLDAFLANPDNVYLLRAPAQTIFQGRRQIFFERVEGLGKDAFLEQTFAQRDGVPLFELWRVR
ncbi:MAG: hypothetical protein KF893_23740 [Caldilineaceae bacterium]|nr:hypothetical protein [Caldilineaceae bacterium]